MMYLGRHFHSECHGNTETPVSLVIGFPCGALLSDIQVHLHVTMEYISKIQKNAQPLEPVEKLHVFVTYATPRGDIVNLKICLFISGKTCVPSHWLASQGVAHLRIE